MEGLKKMSKNWMKVVGVGKSPLLWISSGYFTMALVSTTMGSASAIFFKNIGFSNSKAALYASYLLLAYSIKPIFSPIVEMYKNKKYFVICSQLILSVGFFSVAASIGTLDNVFIFIIILGLLSFVGAVQDIATDGIYITSLNAVEQAKYCGVQSACWNVGALVVSGVFISLCGYLHSVVFNHNLSVFGSDWLEAWRVIFVILATLILLMTVFHIKIMPKGSIAIKVPLSIAESLSLLGESFFSFFKKKNVLLMILFVFSYRMSSAFLDKIGAFFLMDGRELGGLGLTNIDVGSILGTYGTASFLIGSLLGGWYVSRCGLKNSLLILCLAVNAPCFVFLMLAIHQPENLLLIGVSVFTEKFLLGFGAVGQMIYIMQELAPGKYSTSHYAFGTGLLSLCYILSGALSGFLEEALGYIVFFALVTFATLPLFIICWRAPFNNTIESGHV